MESKININFEQNFSKIEVKDNILQVVASIILENNDTKVQIIDNNSLNTVNILESETFDIKLNISDEDTNSAKLVLTQI